MSREGEGGRAGFEGGEVEVLVAFEGAVGGFVTLQGGGLGGESRVDSFGGGDAEVAAATLGAALKYREDSERIRASLDKLLTA